MKLTPLYRRLHRILKLLMIAVSVWFLMMPYSANVFAAKPAKDPLADFSDVEDFLKQANDQRSQNEGKQLQEVLKGLASLLNDQKAMITAYKEAYVHINFSGLPDERVKTTEWETKNKSVWNDTFVWSLKMHIQYLLATLVKSSGKDEEAATMSINWIDAFSKSLASFPEILKQDLLTEGVSRSVFIRANRISKLIKPGGNWYMGDLTKVGEIQRTNVMAMYRAKKDPQLFNIWQTNLKLEDALATRLPLIARKEEFKTDLHPWLLWQMGKDYQSFGLYRQAVDSMVAAIKESPQCENYDNIIEDIKNVIAEARSSKAE
jgi:hypothetical protein